MELLTSPTASSAPPPPPPLPPLHSMNREGKIPIALKVCEAPPGWTFRGSIGTGINDGIAPQTGTYFFYGTLQDPSILQEVLDLPSLSKLRPAYTVGYELKLWGQYPALVDGPPGKKVHGMAFEVLNGDAAAKLVYYETDNYRPEPCSIRVKDDLDPAGEPKTIAGWTFHFRGDERDLTDGDFDLDVWLRHMGRKKAKT